MFKKIITCVIIAAALVIGLSATGALAKKEREEKVVIAAGKTVRFDYVLTVDGERIESSDKGGALEYVHGQRQIIPGLEKNMEGLFVGDTKKILVPAKEAYGEVNPDSFLKVSKTELPANIPLKPGQILSMRTPEGKDFQVIIDEVLESEVVMNFNHPLAGKDLDFEVTIVEIK
ncbi:MAG: FKBP-type peptidyl-prolyl cis-trans isomerase [Candidatus Omnitrophica bacterium]|nr:FKBP-type peptidyl-prolyl cis-trans isomerase [Candidatus Omnitrophota bacterium]MBU1924399.1 FKBP-type peptidyl-prolyl cis-trans isomerase [Candidatus Omnitrophota bacterium]